MRNQSFGLGQLLAVALAMGLMAATTHTAVAAGGRPLNTQLSGDQEVGVGDPDGTGTFRGRANIGAGRLCYTLTAEDIAPATAAHVHVGDRGTNGPVVVPLEAPTDGSSSACATVDRDLLRDIVSDPDHYYVNVHNAEFPGGAVRGQLGRRGR